MMLGGEGILGCNVSIERKSRLLKKGRGLQGYTLAMSRRFVWEVLTELKQTSRP